MERIQITATFPNIAPGDLAEFKGLAAEGLGIAENEAEVLQYDWFFNDDETRCVVRETYENSDAVLAHAANIGELLAKMAALGGGLLMDLFGPASPELVEATAVLQPNLHSFFQGK